MADLIERNVLLDKMEGRYKFSSGQVHKAYGIAIDDICDASSIDAVPVVRCKDCKNYMDAYGTGEMVCVRVVAREDDSDPADMFPLEVKMPRLGFCSYGERRNDDAAD